MLAHTTYTEQHTLAFDAALRDARAQLLAQQDRVAIQQDLQKTQRALERLVDLYLTPDEDEPMPKALYLKKKKALDQEATLYQTQLTALDAQEQAFIEHETQRAEMADMLKAVHELLDEATTIPAHHTIMDMLWLTVYYTPQKDFRLHIMLKKRRPLLESGFVSGFSFPQ